MAKFFGLAEGTLPKGIFKHYVLLIDMSGYHVQEIFNSEMLNFEVPFLTLQLYLKRILSKREKAVNDHAMDSIKEFCIIKTDILKIKSKFDLDLYHIYRHVYDKMIQTAALSVNQFFKIIFKDESKIEITKLVDFLK